MSQQVDPTIPFDASVVDEEALRALRAVQRSLPTGDGGASGNLVGGTEAVAAFGMVRGGLTGAEALRPHEITPLAMDSAPALQDEPLKPLEVVPQVDSSIVLEKASSEDSALLASAAPSPFHVTTVAPPRGSSGYHSTEADALPVLEAAPVIADMPDELEVLTPTVPEWPDPEEPVDASVDAPMVASRDVVGLEDTGIRLDLSTALTDRDGSEVLTLSLLGVPEGTSLSHGTRQADGSWSVPAAELGHLTLTPPEHFSGRIDLTLRVTARESGTGESSTVETAFRVQVEAVADAPSVMVADARGTEDTPVSLTGLGGGLRDQDGSESLGFVLSGVPGDATLSAGTRQPDGTWKLTSGELAGLTLTPPAHFSGRYNLTLTAISTESSNGSQARTSSSFTVGFDPVADTATISGSASGLEDTGITLNPIFTLTDKDGSETWSEFAQVSGVPPGARLSHGEELSPGVWQVSTADLRAGLVLLHPAQHSDADYILAIKATLMDTGNGTSVSREVTGTHAVTVTAVADAPQVSAREVAGQEDTAIPLDLSANLTDADGSELLSVSILNVPPGALLSHGARQSDGSWSIPVADLGHLSLTPPHDFSGTTDLTLRATTRESSNGATATTDVAFQVKVTDVADAPLLTTRDASGPEDTAIAFDLSASLTDTDGSELLSISIIGIPADASLSHGTRRPDGSWIVAPSDLDKLALHPSEHYSGTIFLTAEATSRSSNGSTATTRASFQVQVEAVADAPNLSVSEASGQEDTTVPLNVSAALVDTDGSEVLSVVIGNLPEGARLSAGLNNGDGTWTLTPGQLTNLSLIPPANWSGTANLSVLAHARETSNGKVATTEVTLKVEVEAVADAPVVGSRDVSGVEDSGIRLDLSAALVDRDGSEALTLSLLGVPEGALLSHGTRQPDGSWSVQAADLAQLSLTPPQHFSGTLNLTLRATAHESQGGSATVETTFRVQVQAVADAPSVTVMDARGSEDAPVSLGGLGGALIDRDGSESLSFVLSGVPGDASLSAGTRQPDGTWKLTSGELAGLTLTPPAHFSGSYSLTLTAISTESSNGSQARTSASFTVGFDPVADAGTIAGSSTGQEDTAIVIQPVFATPDPSETWGEFAQVSGVPAGARLSHGTELSPGVWQVSTADLQTGRVSVHPAAHSDADFTLTVKATLIDTGNGTSVSREVTGSHAVSVTAVADAPQVSARDATGQEDMPVALDISAILTDADGSELLSVVIGNMPQGARLSAGLDNGNGTWTLTPAQLTGLKLIPGPEWSGTATLSVQAHARETSNGKVATSEATLKVEGEAVADAPRVETRNVTGQEDSAIPLDLSASLIDVDGSETMVVSILGIPEGFMLSAGTALGEGEWRVPAADLQGLKLMPAADWNGTLNLTVQATSTETSSGSTATSIKPFTVTIDPVNDAPELALTAADHAEAGARQVDVIGTVQADDIDSTQLGGAVITLSGAQPGDRLDLEGFTLHSENGHTMIGNTGIELVGGAFAHETGMLTLSGHASPETYAAVLQSLMLESGAQSGLTAGTRSIGVVLFDSEGAASTRQSVDVVIDEAEPVPPQGQDIAAPGFETTYDSTHADIALLTSDDGSDMGLESSGSWIELTDRSDAPATTSLPMELDQPVRENIHIVDDLQADLGRVTWS